MAMHPELVPNKFYKVPPFEEVKFFDDNDVYAKGVAFYMDQFPKIRAGLLFEKTASYFDSPMAPVRMAALVPKAKIIIVLKEPLMRAYSWYQVV